MPAVSSSATTWPDPDSSAVWLVVLAEWTQTNRRRPGAPTPCLSNLDPVALLEHEQTDPRALTQQRFERMTLAGGDAVPPVDTAGLPDGPHWPSLLQTVSLLRFRHRFHPYLHKKYGDIYTVRLMPKGRPLIFFTRPEHAKEIFAGDPEVFHAGKGNAILGPVMGEHSLLLQDGAAHKRARKLLMPAFNGQALRTYAVDG